MTSALREIADSMYEMSEGHKYISDSIYCAIDNYVDSLGSSEVMRFIDHNTDAVDEIISEFGWDGCNKSVYHATEIAMLRNYEDEVYSDMSEILRYIGEQWLKDARVGFMLTEETESMLDEICSEEFDTWSEFEEALLDGFRRTEVLPEPSITLDQILGQSSCNG